MYRKHCTVLTLCQISYMTISCRNLYLSSYEYTVALLNKTTILRNNNINPCFNVYMLFPLSNTVGLRYPQGVDN